MVDTKGAVSPVSPARLVRVCVCARVFVRVYGPLLDLIRCCNLLVTDSVLRFLPKSTMIRLTSCEPG